MSKRLHHSDFEPHLKNSFKVHSQELGSVNVILAEAVSRNRQGMESYSLIFKGPKEPVLKQMTYKITNNKMGDFRLFLVPINSNTQGGMLYQSVVNRKLEEE